MQAGALKTGIQLWSEDDRPREKMINLSPKNLSNAELLAVLLRSGNAKESAVDLAKRMLAQVDDDLIRLSQMDIRKLMKEFKGVGLAKATAISAAFELGCRKAGIANPSKTKLKGSEETFRLLQSTFSGLKHEEFWVVFLTMGASIIEKRRITTGGVAFTAIDPKLIFQYALEVNAPAMILAHNHPSGDLTPSEEDRKLTRTLHDGGKILDIKVLDHLIFAENTYYSFRDNNDLF